MDTDMVKATGAFALVKGNQKYTHGSETTKPYRGFSFDASRSDGTYGKSSTVQPSSYRVIYIIKF